LCQIFGVILVCGESGIARTIFLKGFFMATILSSCTLDQGKPLPDYSVVNLATNQKPAVLITPAQCLSFPLTPEDINDVKILEAKFDEEKNCAGLAAPQIGIPKQIIVFAAPENQDLKKWRSDFTQYMDKTIWVNPSYKGIGEGKKEDYEACFSVLEVAGPVKRYNKIQYSAYILSGELVEGTAEGFLARIIQHETDHVNGKLFIDYVPKDQLMKIDDYRKKRAEAI
jgi:peptide deformylase